MKNQFENLLKPYKIGSVTIKNRLAMGPMGSAAYYDSNFEFRQDVMDYFVERAKGGFGLLFVGSMLADVVIDPMADVGSPITKPMNFVRSSITLNERLQAYDTKMFLQVTMGMGRNFPGCLTPSGEPLFWMPSVKTQALTNEQVKQKIQLVVQAAALVKNAGFAGVEVHALHWGYLLDQFAMSITNHRTDEYGGSLENRLRASKEIIEGIKQVCGADFPVTMRLGLKSYIKGLNQASLHGEDEAGRTLEEGLRIAQLLESYGYDALSVDSGVYDSFYYASPPMYMPKGYNLELAEAAKKVVKIPILTGGRMDDMYMCEKAIADGQTDAIVLSRASLADPYLPKKVEMGQVEKIRPCLSCEIGCMGRQMTGGDFSCAVNPMALREGTYGIAKAVNPKKVVVVGGGVAGMEVARTAKRRGHEVSLYEKSDKLGGNLISAGAHSFKQDVQKLNEWYQRELKDMNIPVRLKTEVKPDMIKDMGADVVVLAVGSDPVMPKTFSENPKAISCIDALIGKKEIGQKVVIVGGGLVGCEMALEFAQEGKTVTIVEALDTILSAGVPVPIMNKMMLTDLLDYHKVDIRTGFMLDSINNTGAVIIPREGDNKSIEIACDSVIMAIGFKSVATMVQDLYGSGIEIYQVGDGNQVGNIKTSVWNAYEVARSI